MISINRELNPNLDKLKHQFELALEDGMFKKIVSKIKLDKNNIMKYTSSINDCAIELNNCLNCNGLSECQNKIIGYIYTVVQLNEHLNFNYKACRYKKNLDNETKHFKNITFYNLPTNLKNANWLDVDVTQAKRIETVRYLNDFLKNYPTVTKGLYLHGSFGSGKTYLIVAMFNELAKKNIKSAVLFWPEFLRSLKSSFDTDYEDRINYIKKVPLLLIDDLGAEVVTSWARDEILCSILQYRMDENLKTFITSNLDIDALCTHLELTKEGAEVVKAKRIIERIKQLTEQISMIDTNKRNQY